MCRHLAHTGPPVTLSSLVLDPPHSLEHQAHAPNEQVHSSVNADGFAVGWYAPEIRREPAVYRTTLPIWADTGFRSIAGVIRSPCVVAAVRSATPPNPTEISGTAPFAHGRWLCSLNGWIDDVWEGRGTDLRRSLPSHLDSRIRSVSDGDIVLSLVLAELESGRDAADAVGTVVCRLAAGNRRGPLNVVLSDGQQLVATAIGNSLHQRHDAVHGSTTIASEPFDDDPLWARVPDGSLVVATTDTAPTVVPL